MYIIKVKDFLKNLYFVSMILFFLAEFHLKFFWHIPISIFMISIIITFVFYYVYNGRATVNGSDFIKIVLLSSILILQVVVNKGEGIVGQFAKIVCVSTLLFLQEKHRSELFQLIVKVFAFTLLVSLIGWVLVYILGVQLPGYVTTYGSYRFYDYYFFNTRVEGTAITRFLGMYIEPGYTGVLTVLLLVANGFDLKKKENIVLLVSAIATLSFAAYILLIVYLLIRLTSFKVFQKVILVLAGIGTGLFILTIFTNIEDVINYYFLDRVKGLLENNITGNRFSDKFEYFYKYVIKDNKHYYFWGIGSVEYMIRATMERYNSAGYKVYIAQNGLVGTVLVILLYFKSLVPKFNKDYLLLFIIWFLSFLDISYPTWGTFLIYAFLAPYNYEYVISKEKESVI